MHLKYVHYFGNESTESILEAYGLTPKSEQVDKLRPKTCPNCTEPNKVDSKFCAKCRMVLTFDAFTETLEEKSQKESEVKTQFDRLATQISSARSQDKMNAYQHCGNYMFLPRLYFVNILAQPVNLLN